MSALEGGYRIQGGIVSAFSRSVAAHVRALAADHSQAWDPVDAQVCSGAASLHFLDVKACVWHGMGAVDSTEDLVHNIYADEVIASCCKGSEPHHDYESV